jgi:ubiquinone biosynthesis protein
MLKPSVTPTRLLEAHDRPPVVTSEPTPASRFRSVWVLAKFVGLFFSVAGLAIRRRLTIETYASQLRDLFEEIGGLWIKVGQLLSLRIDVFPAELCRELSQMQERSVGFPVQIARSIIEEDLGSPIEQYFDEFDDIPFAAVPMGQVHRARLRQEKGTAALFSGIVCARPRPDPLVRQDVSVASNSFPRAMGRGPGRTRANDAGRP